MKENRMGFKFEHYVLGILLAMEMIMSFTFLGYIHVEPISITTAFIPIVVIACLFGPRESAMAGLLFGLGSMYKASAYYVMPDDKLFSPLQSGFPLGSILLSVGSRVLFGLLIGLIFAYLKKSRYQRVGKSFCALFAPKLHSLLVYGAMGVLFADRGFNITSAFHLEIDDVAISLLCLFLVTIFDIIYHSKHINHYKEAINSVKQDWTCRIRIELSLIIVFVLCIAGFSTIYFSNRTKYMLGIYGVSVTEGISHDIRHLQIQFLAAMVSLNFILILIILLNYTYMKYREMQGELDALTGVMGRRMFLRYCENFQKRIKKASNQKGWFLFVDVDWFKSINDTLGHTVGDKTLQRIAEYLKGTFGNIGAVGRLGGDEFAVILVKELPKDELEERLRAFLLQVESILPERKVSCSIGAYHFTMPMEERELLSHTDKALYKAKERGRACFEILED